MENQAEMAGAVFGRGMAAMIMSIFGFFWFAWSFATISAHVKLPVAIWIVLFATGVVLLGCGNTAVRRSRVWMKAYGASRREFWGRRAKPFRVVTFLELLGIIVVIVLANKFRHPNMIAWGVSVVVGLHFVPLGKIFDFLGYYLVGGLIVVWDFLCIAATNSSDASAFAALGTGVILWATASAILVRSTRLARKLASA